ncbi:MAG: hypothetical protein FWF36_05480 [Propionibacteriaceae bacterium]|nr:hypothetical protein [Propionibacteriaceae bacterium]
MRYLQGNWLAIAAPGGGALLPPDFALEKAMELWDDLRDGCGFSAVLQHLMAVSGSSLVDLPQFAIAVHEDADVHIALRGPLRLTGRAASGDVQVSGLDITTWHEERVVRPTELCMVVVANDEGEHLAWLPLTGGIVRAGALELLAPAVVEIAPEDVPPPPPPPPTPSPSEVVEPPKPSHTGATTLMPDDDADDEVPLHSTTFFADMFADPDAVRPAVPSSAADDDHDGMTVVSLAAEDDHDGMTVLSWPSGPAESPTPQVAAAPIAGPTVLARLCGSCGAPNPTQKVACRICGAALTGDAVRIPRPRLGTITLPSGEFMAIEHPLVIGRRPEVSRFSATDVPVVVKVDDPHISSTHLKVDLEDWSVLVTNLGLNGTILRRPGQPDRGMGDGETVLAQVGDVYDIGSGAALTIAELA